jgi:hypothetical protein
LLQRRSNVVFLLGLGFDNTCSACLHFAFAFPLTCKLASHRRPHSFTKTSLKYANGKSLNAGAVPFLAIPADFERHIDVQLGDVAAVISGNKVAYAVLADHEPQYSLGDGSLQLHEQLGHHVCLGRDDNGACTGVRDVDLAAPVVYLIFFESHDSLCKDFSPSGNASKLCTGVTSENTSDRIRTVGQAAFDKLKKAGTGQTSRDAADAPRRISIL